MLALRKIHRKIAPILFIPLLLTASTGVIFRIGRSWLGLPDRVGDLMLSLHGGSFLGKPLVPIYVLLVGLGLLGTIVSGMTLLKKRKQAASLAPVQFNERKIHQILAPIAFLPLAVSAITGICYRVGKAWFGLSNQQAAIFLKIHQGAYLGAALKPVYVLVVGVSLIAMLLTGIQMSGIFRKRSERSH